MILNIHEHRGLVLDTVFYIGLYQFITGAVMFVINDFTVGRGLAYINFYYEMPEVVEVFFYLILLTTNLVTSLSSMLLPVIKFAIYSVYLGLSSHSDDYEFYYDVAKSFMVGLSFIYTLFITTRFIVKVCFPA